MINMYNQALFWRSFGDHQKEGIRKTPTYLLQSAGRVKDGKGREPEIERCRNWLRACLHESKKIEDHVRWWHEDDELGDCFFSFAVEPQVEAGVEAIEPQVEYIIDVPQIGKRTMKPIEHIITLRLRKKVQENDGSGSNQ
ncbi:hypothetical protein L2E82_13861 [Cichorium intybus]|uniref:Uncharacterized protein n=1 Tax=Cichorium intybus TaxID=13427 RepID=A0ACB9EZ64_CICIN|nr:hypothetical protein L2E82_13861 [Cichorium intybus]